FRGVNAQNFGEYTDGFTPNSAMTVSSGTDDTLPGCTVHDDFTHELGDQNESLLFVALGYRQTSSCSTPPAGLAPGTGIKAMTRPGAGPFRGGTLVRSPLREIRILRAPTR